MDLIVQKVRESDSHGHREIQIQLRILGKSPGVNVGFPRGGRKHFARVAR